MAIFPLILFRQTSIIFFLPFFPDLSPLTVSIHVKSLDQSRPKGKHIACTLTKLSLDPICDFKATSGQQVTLSLTGAVGNVAFEAIKYGGTLLAGLPATEVTFTIHEGQIPRDVAYSVSQGTAGRGSLYGKCPANSARRLGPGRYPVKQYVICATKGAGA